MNKLLFFLILGSIHLSVRAQSYAPPPGQSGSTAIHKDSSAIVSWATNVSVSRGYEDIEFPGGGFTSYGMESDAEGQADGMSVISLGDGGIAIYQLEYAITNEAGPDFAIFENGFTDGYMEFAFVEVSSNGIDFFRFPAISEIPTDTQLNNFSISDCRYVHNLAGKYRANYGTPFDLDEIPDTNLLDKSHVYFVRLVDVIGSIDSNIGSFDSNGNIINDPYPTAFPSGGFDLDGLGIIHEGELGTPELTSYLPRIFPNPCLHELNISIQGKSHWKILDVSGNAIQVGETDVDLRLNTSELASGIYLLQLINDHQAFSLTFVKQ